MAIANTLAARVATLEKELARLRRLVEPAARSGNRVPRPPRRKKTPSAEEAWLRMGGIFKDDPLFDRWQQAIADYRREVEEDPNRP